MLILEFTSADFYRRFIQWTNRFTMRLQKAGLGRPPLRFGRLSHFVRIKPRSLGLLVVALLLSNRPGIAQSVGAPSVSPEAVKVNVSTPVTITAVITGNVIPQSVQVQLLDSSGNPTVIVGKLADDGVYPDLIAGDGVFTGTVSLNGSEIGRTGLLVSAGFFGAPRGAAAVPVSVDVVPQGFPTTDVSIQNPQTDIDPVTGATIVANEVLACFLPETSAAAVTNVAQMVNGQVVGRAGTFLNNTCYQISLPIASAATVANAISTLQVQPSVMTIGPLPTPSRSR